MWNQTILSLLFLQKPRGAAGTQGPFVKRAASAARDGRYYNISGGHA